MEASSNSSVHDVEHQSKWLSILVPAHNAEPYLAKCLGSIFANIRELPENAAASIELIVLDDASKDGSRKIIEDFRSRFSETVSVIEHDVSSGVSAARNSLISQAKGDYIWFIDADDLIAPGIMVDLLDIVSRVKPDYIMCDYATFSNEPTGLSKRAHKATFTGPSNVLIDDRSTALSGLFETGALHPWSKIHRRSLYGDTLTFPIGRIYEDLLVMPLLASRAESFFHVAETWILHRKHRGSLIGSKAVKNTEDKCFALVTLADEFEKEGDSLSRRFQSSFYYFMGRHLRVLFKQLVRSADVETAKQAYRTCSKMLSSTTIRIDDRVRNSLIRRGRLGKLAGLLLWRSRAQKRFE
ncbi:glycosyltransferase family 2 protein [Thioclava electrotropha]|nr:glycosyltransferase family 2 protein [Thioclava electrotropha]